MSLKGQEMSQKGQGIYFILHVSKKIEKDKKRLKTSRVSPWGFMPVGIIIVFSLFYKVNEKSSF